MLSRLNQLLTTLIGLSIGLFFLPSLAAQDVLDDQIESFKTKYSVEIVLEGHLFTPDADGISGADSERSREYLPLFLSEFNLYPTDFVKKSGINKIVICKDLAYKNQMRAAIPGFGQKTMYYDAERGANYTGYRRSVVHHEFFHMVDWRDDGKIYIDKQWAALNPSDFAYGNGGAKVQNDSTQGLTFNKLGFMNKYSTQGVEEDKAEIFAYLVTEQALMERRVKSDPVVAAKVKMMKQLMHSFSESLDEAFWKSAASVKRNHRPSQEDLDRFKGKTVKVMTGEADRVLKHVKSDVAKSFLSAAKQLPEIETFSLYFKFPAGDESKNPLGSLEGISKEEWGALPAVEQQEYSTALVTEAHYYFTKYGSPIMFVRALDLVGQSGLDSLEGKKIVDFGFGSIGHLRMMASNGADVTGIDVDPSLRGIYSREPGVGTVSRSGESGIDGKLRLLFGRFPVEAAMANQAGTGIDVFFSKNTLKRGYIHPEQEVEPKRMIDLGVSDAEFVQTVYDRLKPGGYFMIYNLHPKRTETGEKYIPWSDGRSPFTRADLTGAGFKVIQFDCDDTPAAHSFATSFGWDKQMDLDKSFRATYTLLKK